jgi:hypothetical protein
MEARAVIIAAGGFQNSIIPALSAALGPDVAQLTASTYRTPADVTVGPVSW